VREREAVQELLQDMTEEEGMNQPYPQIRYASLEDWEADCKEGGMNRKVPRLVEMPDRTVYLNPAWLNAPMAVGFIELPDTYECRIQERE